MHTHCKRWYTALCSGQPTGNAHSQGCHMAFWCVGPYLELPLEVAHRGDPGSDDCQEGGGNDGHGALDGAQAQQQSLGDPAGTCTHSLGHALIILVTHKLLIAQTPIWVSSHVFRCSNTHMLAVSYQQSQIWVAAQVSQCLPSEYQRQPSQQLVMHSWVSQ